MSKQKKLAAFLEAYEYFIDNGTESGAAQRAFHEYRFAPDDPPQPPEMPECVREFVDAVRLEVPGLFAQKIAAVRDHYRQPLKLEVGKVYEDASGVNVMVAWIDPAGRFETIGVDLMTGAARYFKQDGTNGSRKSASLIREVAQ